MFTELNSILNESPENFSTGEFVLLSDRQSDASFLIHHFLGFYLRAGCQVCFVGLAQSLSHYSAVSQRLGVSLSQAKEKGQLVFLEGLNESLSILNPDGARPGSQAMDFLRNPGAGLRSLFQSVHSSLTSQGAESGSLRPPALLVDDVSVLQSLGVSVDSVLDFSHYCRALVCSQLKGNVVMLLRCDGEDDDDDTGSEESSERLLRGLTHQCSLSLSVQGLPTGYCRDIHGQLEVWDRRRQADGQDQKKTTFQYKVHDKGASFFAPGTSSAVL
ncbi:elongator complex protein 6 [Corythoichthys intestinalis]|uniref:elongator complex protein 6 n=1 Tax=Corythoichthys intestinalis TaxID=161448 RepID=UPI0025A5C95E|nr:elongator complex protein 6 [Corythoichthys intestinalis]XP_061789822.1 elongator complex protein 6-like [Nerophis lumbriciformis]